MMSDFEVHIPDESSMHDFLVAFPGPEDSECVVSITCIFRRLFQQASEPLRFGGRVG